MDGSCVEAVKHRRPGHETTRSVTTNRRVAVPPELRDVPTERIVATPRRGVAIFHSL